MIKCIALRTQVLTRPGLEPTFKLQNLSRSTQDHLATTPYQFCYERAFITQFNAISLTSQLLSTLSLANETVFKLLDLSLINSYFLFTGTSSSTDEVILLREQLRTLSLEMMTLKHAINTKGSNLHAPLPTTNCNGFTHVVPSPMQGNKYNCVIWLYSSIIVFIVLHFTIIVSMFHQQQHH